MVREGCEADASPVGAGKVKAGEMLGAAGDRTFEEASRAAFSRMALIWAAQLGGIGWRSRLPSPQWDKRGKIDEHSCQRPQASSAGD